MESAPSVSAASNTRKDSRLPAEFDLTALVTASSAEIQQHVLSLRVYRFCDGSYLEDQDHWWLSGLHRGVYLYSKPEDGAILDYEVTAGLPQSDTERPAGQLEVSSSRILCMGPSKSIEVRVELFGPHRLGTDRRMEPPLSPDDEPVVTLKTAVDMGESIEEGAFRVKAEIPEVEPWSAEDPVLYTMVLSLYGGVPRSGGKPPLLDRESCEVSHPLLSNLDCNPLRVLSRCQVGFRDVRVSGNQLLVNGKAIMIAGVNRHDHDPDTGKTVSLESMFEDVALLKRFNFNAIRTCHYPNMSEFYDVCDALGM